MSKQQDDMQARLIRKFDSGQYGAVVRRGFSVNSPLAHSEDANQIRCNRITFQRVTDILGHKELWKVKDTDPRVQEAAQVIYEALVYNPQYD